MQSGKVQRCTSPVWIRLCAIKCAIYFVANPHASHKYGCSLLWEVRCCSNVLRMAYALPQVSPEMEGQNLGQKLMQPIMCQYRHIFLFLTFIGKLSSVAPHVDKEIWPGAALVITHSAVMWFIITSFGPMSYQIDHFIALVITCKYVAQLENIKSFSGFCDQKDNFD